MSLHFYLTQAAPTFLPGPHFAASPPASLRYKYLQRTLLQEQLLVNNGCDLLFIFAQMTICDAT
jgi:hypothetical protein